MYKELLEYIVKNLVSNKDSVVISEKVEHDGTLSYHIDVAKEDMGRVIGKEGRIIKSIRILTNSYANHNGDKVNVFVNNKEK